MSQGGQAILPGRPRQPLVVRLNFSNLPRRINFQSAATCRFETLKQRVEECYHLSASMFFLSYVDEDGEETAIRTEADWTDTINWFLSGEDDASLGHVAGPSKITVRLDITVEYDGPSLSDTSSLAGSSEDYATSEGEAYDLESESASEQSYTYSSGGSNSRSSDSRARSPPRAALARAPGSSTSRSASSRTEMPGEMPRGGGVQQPPWSEPRTDASDLSSRWLAEQTRLARRKMGTASGSSKQSVVSASDDESFIDSEDGHSIGNLSLSRDVSGRFYYSYNGSPRIKSSATLASLPPLQPPTQAVSVLTHCSACQAAIDFMCYVCADCPTSSQVVLSPTSEGGSERTAWASGRLGSPSGESSDGSDGSDTVYNEPRHRSASLSTHASEDSGGYAASHHRARRAFQQLGRRPYHVCPSCLETAGLVHAKESEQLSGKRHAFQELIKDDAGWTVVAQNKESTCGICDAATGEEYFRCASCVSLSLCKQCYIGVSECHPPHVFLHVGATGQSMDSPDQYGQCQAAQSSSSETTARGLEHSGAFCHNCLDSIVGVRYHCAVCPSWDLCARCEGSREALGGQHTADHIMMKIPQPLPPAEVALITRQARDRWYQQDSPALRQVEAGPSSSRRMTPSPAEVSRDAHHNVSCDNCHEWISGTRFQCANCPSQPQGYSLCSACEVRSHRVHDPLHAFLQLERPVDWPLSSSEPLLPILYRSKVGKVPASAANHPRTSTSYLSYLIHHDTVCDIHGDQIRGVWLRCVHCPDGYDMCIDAKHFAAHDPTHVFLVLKAPVNMQIFRNLVALDSDARRPLIPQRFYRD